MPLRSWKHAKRIEDERSASNRPRRNTLLVLVSSTAWQAKPGRTGRLTGVTCIGSSTRRWTSVAVFARAPLRHPRSDQALIRAGSGAEPPTQPRHKSITKATARPNAHRTRIGEWTKMGAVFQPLIFCTVSKASIAVGALRTKTAYYVVFRSTPARLSRAFVNNFMDTRIAAKLRHDVCRRDEVKVHWPPQVNATYTEIGICLCGPQVATPLVFAEI